MQVRLFVYMLPLMQKLQDYDFGGLKMQVLVIILIANKCRTRKNNVDCTYKFQLKWYCSGGKKKAADPSGQLSASISPMLAVSQEKLMKYGSGEMEREK